MKRRVAIASLTLYGAAGIVVLLLVPPLRTRPAVDRLTAALVGVAGAATLFVILGGGRPRRPSARLLRLLVLLVGVAAFEEIAWRGGVLGGLGHLVGWPAAWVLSTAGFALRHLRGRAARAALPYLLLGGCFGGVFLATGRLLGAIVAHAAYNVLAASSRA